MYALLLTALWAVGAVSVVLAALAWAIAHLVRASWVLRRSAEVAGLARPSVTLLLESLAFGIRAWTGTLARFLNFRADQVLMGFIATESTLGVYAVAVNASEVLLYLPSTTALALLPAVSRSDPGARSELVLRGFRSAALITLAGMIVALLLGPTLLPVVFGAEFDASVTPFLLLLPGALGFVAMAVFSSGLAASALPGRSSLGPVVSLVLGLTTALLLIPAYGASGAAAASSIAFLAGGAVSAALYRRSAPFDWSLLVLPRRGDLDVLLALARPLRKRSGRDSPPRQRRIAEHRPERVQDHVVDGRRSPRDQQELDDLDSHRQRNADASGLTCPESCVRERGSERREEEDVRRRLDDDLEQASVVRAGHGVGEIAEGNKLEVVVRRCRNQREREDDGDRRDQCRGTRLDQPHAACAIRSATSRRPCLLRRCSKLLPRMRTERCHT